MLPLLLLNLGVYQSRSNFCSPFLLTFIFALTNQKNNPLSLHVRKKSNCFLMPLALSKAAGANFHERHRGKSSQADRCTPFSLKRPGSRRGFWWPSHRERFPSPRSIVRSIRCCWMLELVFGGKKKCLFHSNLFYLAWALLLEFSSSTVLLLLCGWCFSRKS